MIIRLIVNLTVNFISKQAKEAANKLALALENSHFGGMKTNRDYLVSILRSKEYLEGDTTTDFVERVNLNSEIAENMNLVDVRASDSEFNPDISGDNSGNNNLPDTILNIPLIYNTDGDFSYWFFV